MALFERQAAILNLTGNLDINEAISYYFVTYLIT